MILFTEKSSANRMPRRLQSCSGSYQCFMGKTVCGGNRKQLMWALSGRNHDLISIAFTRQRFASFLKDMQLRSGRLLCYYSQTTCSPVGFSGNLRFRRCRALIFKYQVTNISAAGHFHICISLHLSDNSDKKKPK